MHGDDAGPRSSQEVSLQVQAWVKGVHGQAQPWLSWRPALSPAQPGQGLKDQGWAYIEPLGPWAGYERRPQVRLVRATKAGLWQPRGNRQLMKEEPINKLFLSSLKKFCNSIQLHCCYLIMKKVLIASWWWNCNTNVLKQIYELAQQTACNCGEKRKSDARIKGTWSCTWQSTQVLGSYWLFLYLKSLEIPGWKGGWRAACVRLVFTYTCPEGKFTGGFGQRFRTQFIKALNHVSKHE